MANRTEAWILRAGHGGESTLGTLERDEITFDEINDDEVLVRPIYGCWEGNMADALERRPTDICRVREEPYVVLGNSGVCEVLQKGANVLNVKVGDRAILFCNGEWDRYGYPKTIFAYDTPNTVGFLAKRTKVHYKQLITIPKGFQTYDLKRWAAFSLRYVAAFSNWRMAFGVLRLQVGGNELPDPFVWGWGGGVALAELHLAHLNGCRTAQVSSRQDRREAAEKLGIIPIDRNEFPDLRFDDTRFKVDAEYRARYRDSENRFLEIVSDLTGGGGVNIFIDYVGSPITRATLKAMAREGVLTTAGWKGGMLLWFLRASECIARHQHVHTHYARYPEGVQAVRFGAANGWLPTVDERVYTFDEIPELHENYLRGDFTYFPVYQVNPEE